MTAPTNEGLSWQCFPAGANGFFRAPVLVSGPGSGPGEAVLIDGGFTLPDGRAVAEAIGRTGKRLTTIYVSQSDPDYYFSLGPIKAAYPDARVVAAPETVAAIRDNVAKKLEIWSPQLGENGPRTLADVVIPEPDDARTIAVNGAAIEIIDAEGLANRRYLRVPALNAVFGGVLVFSGVHVWTADTKGAVERTAWRSNLEAIAASRPAVVVPGHMAPDAATDASGVAFTLAYLTEFEDQLGKAADGAVLNAAMRARYPGLGMEVAIDVGAKVATGEMNWG